MEPPPARSGNVGCGNTGYGIDIQSSVSVVAHLSVTGNWITGSTYGVYVLNQQFVTIDGNDIDTCCTRIYLSGITRIGISDNNIDVGIDFTSGTNTYITINGNHVGRADQGNTGKSNIQGSASYVAITGNTFTSGGKADYAVHATGSAWLVTVNMMNGGGVSGAVGGSPTSSTTTGNLT